MRNDRQPWLLTEKGVLDRDGVPSPDVPFQGTSADVGDHRGGRTAVVVDEHEVWTFEGGAWTQQGSSDVSMYCVAWTLTGDLLVGTERARVAWIRDGKLAFLEAFDEVPERPLWNTPFGAPPAVRSLAVATDGTLYANVHVGWIVRSRDGGTTWESLQNGLEKDVHQVAAHPSRPETVFAATANGFHTSHDHGAAFTRRVEGLPYYYQRATACFPDRDVYLVSTARHDGGAGARLDYSEDGGHTWTRAEGLPEDLDRNINTFQIALLSAGHGFVVVDDTSLYESRDWGHTWKKVGDYPRIWSLLAR